MKLAFQAFDKSGRVVSDVVEAADAQEATQSLRRQGLFVTRMDAAADNAASTRGSGRRRLRIGTGKRLKALAMFTRQLHVLVSTGTPLSGSIASLERQMKDPRWRDTVHDVRTRVEEGSPLSEAMAAHPRWFDAIYRSLITAGESSGDLAAMLDRLAALVRKQVQVRSCVVGAMVYPALLLTVSVGVLITMFTFVLPRFTELFATLDVPLPPTTVMLMNISYALRTYWWAMLLGIGGAVVGLRLWLRSPAGKARCDHWMLRLPMIGRITRSFATARITRLLGVLSESDVPLLDALQLTRAATANVRYSTMLDEAEQAVMRGRPVSSAFADEALVDPAICEALRHGEASGQLGPLLLNMADYLDEENDVVIRSLTSILEPVILLLLGAIVAFVALSIFLPLFDLTAMTGGA